MDAARAYIASDPEVTATYEKIRRHARGIRISGYDITKRCNLRCEGCFFFEGELSSHYADDKSDPDYEDFFRSEVERGVNFPHFAGAEPALVQGRLRIANRYWQRGLVYTNGTIPIDPDITFMIHASLWGAPETDSALRGAAVFRKTVKNYAGDRRAVVMMTINRHNLEEIPVVARACSDAGLRLSFNHYSPSRQYLRKVNGGEAPDTDTFRLSSREDNLTLTPDDLRRVQDRIGEALRDWPETVIYSPYYNAWINDPVPRFDIDAETGMARDCPILNLPYHRQYHTDFSYSDDECCVANIDCTGCRHYVSGYTKIMAERNTHFATPEGFRGWVEVFDTWCRLHFPDWDSLA